MLKFDRKQNFVKQLSFNKKIKIKNRAKHTVTLWQAKILYTEQGTIKITRCIRRSKYNFEKLKIQLLKINNHSG